MAGVAHFGVGFAARRFAPRVPLFVFLIASELIDLIWIVLSLTGVEKADAPWSHGLFMGAVWSILTGLLIALVYRHLRSGLVLGGVVFGHWLLDFVTHPMGAIYGNGPQPPDLFIFFEGSKRVGLGLYNHSALLAYSTDIILFGLGIGLYAAYQSRKRKIETAGLNPAG